MPPCESPIVPCHPRLRGDAHRALVGATREVEHALANLQRRAYELDLDGFARQVAGVASALADVRGELSVGGGGASSDVNMRAAVDSRSGFVQGADVTRVEAPPSKKIVERRGMPPSCQLLPPFGGPLR